MTSTIDEALDQIQTAIEQLHQSGADTGMLDAITTAMQVIRDESSTRRSKRLLRTGPTKRMIVADGKRHYKRNQPHVMVTWDCAICGTHHSRSMLPGATPKYCLPVEGEKTSNCQRIARRQQMAQRRAQAGNKTSDKPRNKFILMRRHLPLLHKAAARGGQHYVGRESASRNVLSELVQAGLAVTVEIKAQRVYYKLTEAGYEASERKTHTLAM